MEFSNKYQLFVVYNLEKEIPSYEEIPMEFWNNDNFRRTDIIEKIEFINKFKTETVNLETKENTLEEIKVSRAGIIYLNK